MKRLLTLTASFVCAGALGYLGVNALARHLDHQLTGAIRSAWGR